jgi:hypothetical protein
MAMVTASCGSKKVFGKTYVTSGGDTIQFHSDGTATERNGNPGVAYAGQAVSFDDAGMPAGTACKYNQNADKITLTCEEGAQAVYTVNDDGSLAGPPAGLYGHPAFAHLVEKK